MFAARAGAKNNRSLSVVLRIDSATPRTTEKANRQMDGNCALHQWTPPNQIAMTHYNTYTIFYRPSSAQGNAIGHVRPSVFTRSRRSFLTMNASYDVTYCWLCRVLCAKQSVRPRVRFLSFVPFLRRSLPFCLFSVSLLLPFPFLPFVLLFPSSPFLLTSPLLSFPVPYPRLSSPHYNIPLFVPSLLRELLGSRTVCCRFCSRS